MDRTRQICRMLNLYPRSGRHCFLDNIQGNSDVKRDEKQWMHVNCWLIEEETGDWTFESLATNRTQFSQAFKRGGIDTTKVKQLETSPLQHQASIWIRITVTSLVMGLQLYLR